MKRITLLALTTALLVLSVFTSGTFAWFTEIKSNKKTFEVGNIKYSYFSPINVPGYKAIPGGDIFDGSSEGLTVVNESNIDTNLRFKLLVSYTDASGVVKLTDAVYAGPTATDTSSLLITSLLDIQFADDWIYDSVSKCFQYLDSEGEAINIPAATDPAHSITGIDAVKVFNKMVLDETNITSDYSGANLVIKVIFQAKQAKYVNWVQIGVADIDALIPG